MSAAVSLASSRKKAREMLVQSLYQWELAGQDPVQIEAQFHADNNMDKVDVEYYGSLLRAICSRCPDIDSNYTALLDRRLDELDPVSLSILRIGAYEMAERPDVPFRVVINEAVNLAKKFGPQDSQKFVNAVMDRLVPRHRKAELHAARTEGAS